MLNDLLKAIQKDDIRTVAVLLEAGINPNDFEDEDRITPLHFAAQKNTVTSIQIARLLLEAGADPNIRTALEGQTPLDIALEASCFLMADFLRGQKKQIPKNVFKRLMSYNLKKRKEQSKTAKLKAEKLKAVKSKAKEKKTKLLEAKKTEIEIEK